MDISKIGGEILDALTGGEKVFAEALEAITPKYKSEINVLKKEGANIRGFQDKGSGKIFYVLDMAEETGEETPPDVRPPATSSPPPAAPTSGSSPAEGPGLPETEDIDRLIIGLPDPLEIVLSEVTSAHFPKTGRVKFTGWVEAPTEKKDLQRYLLDNETAEYFMILSTVERIETPPEVFETEIDKGWGSPAPGAAETEEDSIGLDETEEGDPDHPGPVQTTTVPIYDGDGNVVGYKHVEVIPPKTKEEIREEVKESGLSSSAAAGMEGLLDKGPDKAPDSNI